MPPPCEGRRTGTGGRPQATFAAQRWCAAHKTCSGSGSLSLQSGAESAGCTRTWPRYRNARTACNCATQRRNADTARRDRSLAEGSRHSQRSARRSGSPASAESWGRKFPTSARLVDRSASPVARGRNPGSLAADIFYHPCVLQTTYLASGHATITHRTLLGNAFLWSLMLSTTD